MKVPTPSGADSPGTDGSARLSPGRARLIRTALLRWYRSNARPLRIRSTRAPWPVLVAEVMSQQTQIERVESAWSAFLARFPGPRSLAEATPADVLRAWSGLGYNRRALDLQRAARVILAEYGGQVPGTVAELEALPGVGPYTARAVAALAFGRPVVPVDTNVRRVIRRWLGATPNGRDLQAVADSLADHVDAATWAHAVMELGATVCRAGRPDCGACPVSAWCTSAGRVDARSDPAAPVVTRRTSSAVPFERTTRWLRGRIVARLRDAEAGAWAELPERMGEHGPREIAAAVAALQGEGLLERRVDGTVRLPSGTP